MKKLLLTINDDLDYDLIRLLLNKLNIDFKDFDESEHQYFSEEAPKEEADIQRPEEETEVNKRNTINDFTFEYSQQTIDSIIAAVKIIQKNYFSSGLKKHIVPMIYKDIADIVGKDVSSVSRVLDGKGYVISGKQHFYKDLFSQHDFSTFDGRPVSRFEVCDLITVLIDNEDKKKPMTDDDIAEELQKQNYDIARRTVAKYRAELLNIPKSFDRR